VGFGSGTNLAVLSHETDDGSAVNLDSLTIGA
jgi:hypothetical protein